MSLLSASSFSDSGLGVGASTSAVLYQRNAVNVIGATPTNGAVNIGNLTTNSTNLDVTGQLAPQNQTNYYNFTLNGNSLALDLENLTDSSTGVPLRAQLINSSGQVVADNAGTPAQQTAFAQLTSQGALKTNSGNYTLAVSYGPGEVTANPQSYSVSLYSGTIFDSSYQTTAAPQTSPNQNVVVDSTDTFATSDAQLFSTQQYNKIDATAETAINVGWLYQNKTALQVTSQVTQADQNDYYSLSFEQGSALKLAFDNQTNTTGLRVQLLDSTGTDVVADSDGTAAQQQAYAALTSSSGLQTQNGQYVVKVSYDKSANTSQTQTYDFSLYSGTSYSTLDETSASAETYGHAVIAGDLGTSGYSATQATASFLYSQSQGLTSENVQSVLETIGADGTNPLSGVLSA